MGWRYWYHAVCLLLAAIGASALDNGLSLTPAMGYNTWNAWHDQIDEAVVKKTAELMVSSGLASAGYKYLVIDDAWSKRFRDHGRVVANPKKFPSGMKNMSEYLHSKGLLFGMYSDAGALTCLGFPGSRGNELVDAQTFADWGVDFLKYDNCWAPAADWVVSRYEAMRDALNATDRPILFSMCDWGVADPWLGWGKEVGNSWRTTEDIAPNWPSVLANLDNTVGLAKYAGPGGWNDPDILEVGNGDLTLNEQRSHFALWALLKAPLMVGADLSKLPAEGYQILLAKEVIAVNQDKLGVAGDLVWKEGPAEVYAAPLEGGARAVVFFNRHVIGTQYPISNVTVEWSALGLNASCKCTVRDLFARKDLGTFSRSLTLPVDIHDARMVVLKHVEKSEEHDEWRPWHTNGAIVAEVQAARGVKTRTAKVGRKVNEAAMHAVGSKEIEVVSK
jgi:alpha-galactosidase